MDQRSSSAMGRPGLDLEDAEKLKTTDDVERGFLAATMVVVCPNAIHVFFSAGQPFLERAGRRALCRNRARDDRAQRLARAAPMVCAAPGQAATDILGCGCF